MPDERRGGRRSPTSAVRITYEGASGSRVDAEVLDLTAGGMFIRTDVPLAVGKRIALDLHVAGEPGPWSALGRIVWSRPEPDQGRPAGMGVKLIDVDDATVEAIERLIEASEPTKHGLGAEPPLAASPVVAVHTSRDRTLMGVGFTPEPPAPLRPSPTVFVHAPAAAPVESSEPLESPDRAGDLPPAPEEIPALTQVQAPVEPIPPPADQSLAIELVVPKRVRSSRPPAQTTVPSLRSMATSTPTDRSARWVVAVLMFVVASIAAYVIFGGFLRPLGR